MPLSESDPTSFSLPDQHVIKHLHLIWNVDFNSKVIKGRAQLNIEEVNARAEELILDVSSLIILSITLLNGSSLSYNVDENIENIGSKLTIQLPKDLEKCFVIDINYQTSPSATGLQWLEPLQTCGRKHPYLFSQFQAIHARSVVPCQDTAAVKFTYTAEVTATSNFTILMSALREKNTIDSSNGTVTQFFNQPVPVPSYLIAIAVGMLSSRKLGPRSAVWAEEEIIEKCAWEFADTDKMLKTAEDICGPYVWGIYDLLVLPPSFPYGGMENPCLTFVTPTLLAGDRSLADVIVHEITHSWTGNLVSNRNWEHFWLNEGFTIFIERKITSRLSGDTKTDYKYRDFHYILGLESLKETIYEHLGENNPLTNLVVNLKGLNPDDAFSTVPYEKGSTFLRYLEHLLGGPDIFEPFLRHYLNVFQRKSIDTNDFKNLLEEYFKGQDVLSQVEWEKWLHTPGMPLRIPKYDNSLSKACTELVNRWIISNGDYASFNKSDITNMSSLQRQQFLTELHREHITMELVKALDNIYELNAITNAEVKCKWLRICIKVRWMDKVKDALQFVNDQGRMKFVRPIYRDLYSWEDVRQRAIDNFLANEKYMMHISVYGVKKDLHLN